MPFGDVIDFADTGRVLQARERVNAVNDAALVAGTMKKSHRGAHLRDLNEAASGGVSSGSTPKPQQSGEQVAAELASIGIPVERV